MKIKKFVFAALIQLHSSCNYERCSLSETLLLTLVGNLPYYMTYFKKLIITCSLPHLLAYLRTFILTSAANELKKSKSPSCFDYLVSNSRFSFLVELCNVFIFFLSFATQHSLRQLLLSVMHIYIIYIPRFIFICVPSS